MRACWQSLHARPSKAAVLEDLGLFSVVIPARVCLGLIAAFLSVCAPGAEAPAPESPADAQLPAGVSLNWDKPSIVQLNAKRAQISLSGIWRFIPAAEGASAPPKAGCGRRTR